MLAESFSELNNLGPGAVIVIIALLVFIYKAFLD